MEPGKKRKRKRPLPPRACRCGVVFIPNTTWHKFHSRECRDADWEEKNRRVNPERTESFEHLVKMVREAEWDSPLFREMQKAVYSKTQMRTRGRKRK